jgi:hypothetical protein
MKRECRAGARYVDGGWPKPSNSEAARSNFAAVCLEFLAFFEDFPSNSLEIKRFGRVWREGNGTAKTSCGFDCAV